MYLLFVAIAGLYKTLGCSSIPEPAEQGDKWCKRLSLSHSGTSWYPFYTSVTILNVPFEILRGNLNGVSGAPISFLQYLLTGKILAF